MTQGRSIRLFLVDGTPTGIITAEIMNWTGHVIVAPRSRLADFVQRPEAGRTGVYFLVGENPDSALKPLVYIGETDNVGKRLAQHNKDDKKGFFDRICVVTSKDPNLTKAHVRYLEGRLIGLAGKIGRSKIVNGTEPDFGLLPEADLADMDFFIDQIRIVLPVLGLEFLRETGAALLVEGTAAAGDDKSGIPSMRSGPSSAGQKSPVFALRFPKASLVARAVEVDGRMVLLRGSQIRKKTGKLIDTIRQQRDDMVASGTVVEDPNNSEVWVLREEVDFGSPSRASDVVLGRGSNGRKEWVIPETGATYADWQEAQVAAHAPAGGEE